MNARQKLTKLPESEIKRILGETTPRTEQSGGEPEEALTERELACVGNAAKSDYEKLCDVLVLSPVPLDVYCPSKQSTNRTRLGTPESNFTPLYDSQKIVLPIVAGASGQAVLENLAFPSVSWDKMNPEWPRWRLDLWHEALHQVEKDIYDSWEGGEIHGESYMQAIKYATSKLSVLKAITEEQLRVLTLGG